MKAAGAVVLVIGLLIVGLFFAIPTTVSAFGFSESCGMPVFAAVIPASDRAASGGDLAVAEVCRRQSIQRVIAGVGVGGIGVLGGLVMLNAARRRH